MLIDSSGPQLSKQMGPEAVDRRDHRRRRRCSRPSHLVRAPRWATRPSSPSAPGDLMRAAAREESTLRSGKAGRVWPPTIRMSALWCPVWTSWTASPIPARTAALHGHRRLGAQIDPGGRLGGRDLASRPAGELGDRQLRPIDLDIDGHGPARPPRTSTALMPPGSVTCAAAPSHVDPDRSDRASRGDERTVRLAGLETETQIRLPRRHGRSPAAEPPCCRPPRRGRPGSGSGPRARPVDSAPPPPRPQSEAISSAAFMSPMPGPAQPGAGGVDSEARVDDTAGRPHRVAVPDQRDASPVWENQVRPVLSSAMQEVATIGDGDALHTEPGSLVPLREQVVGRLDLGDVVRTGRERDRDARALASAGQSSSCAAVEGAPRSRPRSRGLLDGAEPGVGGPEAQADLTADGLRATIASGSPTAATMLSPLDARTVTTVWAPRKERSMTVPASRVSPGDAGAAEPCADESCRHVTAMTSGRTTTTRGPGRPPESAPDEGGPAGRRVRS